jgi:hypothetical protein
VRGTPVSIPFSLVVLPMSDPELKRIQYGGEIFFYCTLKALIEICEKAIKNKDFSFPQFLTPKEGIVDCLISEILENNSI